METPSESSLTPAQVVAAKIQETMAASADPGTCDVRLVHSKLRFCARKVVASKTVCYWHLADETKYKSEAISDYFGRPVTIAEALEEEVRNGNSLESAFLRNCSLGGSFLQQGADLTGGWFAMANLYGAILSECNLTGASFAGADLRCARLSSCKLTDVVFFNARLFDTKFRSNDLSSVKHLTKDNFKGLGKFGFPKARILETYPEQAAPMYLEMVSYFTKSGQYEAASWAAYRASLLRHKLLRREVSLEALRAKRFVSTVSPSFLPVQGPLWAEYLIAVASWLQSALFLLVTGYGEKPFRVIFTAFVAILAYAGIYCMPGAISGKGFSDSLYFSVITFTTLGYGDMLPHGGFRLVAGSEALFGILFTGLFLFCLGRRTVSRS